MGLKRILALAAAVVLAGAVAAAYSASADLTLNTQDGTSIAVTVTPAVLTLITDVVNPGADWTFGSNPNGKAWPWLPDDTNTWKTAWKYTPGGSFGCVQVSVTTYLSSWELRTYRTVTPAAPLEVALADRGSGGTCSEPTDAFNTTKITATSAAGAQLLLGGQSGPADRYYGVAVRATSAVSGNPVITLTFLAQ